MLAHLAGILILTGIGGVGLWQVARAEAGVTLLMYLLPVVLAFVGVPWLLYRIYTLFRSAYTLSRDGVAIRWGLRAEDIPMNQIQWVGPASELGFRLPLPFLRLPGVVMGIRRLPDNRRVEFMAAQANSMIVIATLNQLFVLTPADLRGFLKAFQRFAELGSLSPIPARSIYPVLLLSRSWEDLPVRILMVSGLGLNLLLLVWVGLAIPGRASISLRFTSEGAPLEYVPAVRLLLLPVLNIFFLLVDMLVGLFYYRRSESRVVAYLLWICGVLTSLLFLGGAYFILQSR